SGSLLAMAQLTTSGADELGVSNVMNLKTPSSFWMSPRQSLSSWLRAISASDIIRVLDVPSLISVNLTNCGVLRLPLLCANGAPPLLGGGLSYRALPQLTT